MFRIYILTRFLLFTHLLLYSPLLLCGVLLIIVLSVLALISGAIMKVFGFEYRSIGSIILFFIIATIISYPLGLIAGALPKALLSLDKVSMPTAITLYLILDTFATFWGLRITDYCMQSISAEDISIFVISLIFAFLGVSDIKKSRMMKNNKSQFVERQ